MQPARGSTRLLLCASLVAVAWLELLPRGAELPIVRDHIERLRRLGIDPRAKFYTELPRLERAEELPAAGPLKPSE